MDFNTWSAGGSGFDTCNNCHFSFTFQTDKYTYAPGETVNIIETQTDPVGDISIISGAQKLLVAGNGYDFSNPWNFSEDTILTDNNWIGSSPTIYTNPIGPVVSFDSGYSYNPYGWYVVNYNGVYDPDDANEVLFPFTTFQVAESAPTNNNPQVNVR
jgi:hypothetical protein